jgi:hypothetical protein
MDQVCEDPMAKGQPVLCGKEGWTVVCESLQPVARIFAGVASGGAAAFNDDLAVYVVSERSG